jgi:hypothetical protein
VRPGVKLGQLGGVISHECPHASKVREPHGQPGRRRRGKRGAARIADQELAGTLKVDNGVIQRRPGMAAERHAPVATIEQRPEDVRQLLEFQQER